MFHQGIHSQERILVQYWPRENLQTVLSITCPYRTTKVEVINVQIQKPLRTGSDNWKLFRPSSVLVLLRPRPPCNEPECGRRRKRNLHRNAKITFALKTFYDDQWSFICGIFVAHTISWTWYIRSNLTGNTLPNYLLTLSCQRSSRRAFHPPTILIIGIVVEKIQFSRRVPTNNE